MTNPYDGKNEFLARLWEIDDPIGKEAAATLERVERERDVLMDHEFVDYEGEPTVTSGAAYREIMHLRAQAEALRSALQAVSDADDNPTDLTARHEAWRLAAAALASSTPESSPQPLSPGERYELECLRHRVQQLDYPCSPHCDGYLRELAMRNARSAELGEPWRVMTLSEFFALTVKGRFAVEFDYDGCDGVAVWLLGEAPAEARSEQAEPQR